MILKAGRAEQLAYFEDVEQHPAQGFHAQVLTHSASSIWVRRCFGTGGGNPLEVARRLRANLCVMSRWVMFLGATASLLFVSLLGYFHWHSDQASSHSLLLGAIRLHRTTSGLVEVEPGRLMLDARHTVPNGVGAFRHSGLEQFLGAHGWQFADQMGAGLDFKRGKQSPHGLLTSCGPHYMVVVLDQDPSTGKDLNLPRPFNLFR